MFRLCSVCKKEFNEYLVGAHYSSAAGLYYTSVQMNVPRAILTMRGNRNHAAYFFTEKSRFIFGQPSNNIREVISMNMSWS
jgi:hypothetical protein